MLANKAAAQTYAYKWALKTCDWDSTSVKTRVIFQCRMYFWHSWMDGTFSADMLMFDVSEDQIQYNRKTQKSNNFFSTGYNHSCGTPFGTKLIALDKCLKDSLTVFHYVNL